MKFFGLLAVDFVLKFQIFIGVVASGPAAEIAGSGVSSAGEGLGGEIGASTETIGTTEGGVGELGEAAYWRGGGISSGRFVVFGGWSP